MPFIALAAFLGILVGLVALVRGSLVSLGLKNRRAAAGLLVVCLVVFAVSVPPADPETEPEPYDDPTEASAAVEAGPGEGVTDDPEDEADEAAEEGDAPDQPEGEEAETGTEVEVSEAPRASEEAEAVGQLAVHFIDVGQGDAILLEAPDAAVLIDAGTRGAGEIVVQYLVRRGIRRIDLVIATHPHADHIGGLIQVLRNFQVDRIIDSGQPHTTKTFDDYLTEVERQVDEGHCVFEVPEDQVVDLGSGAVLTVLGPDTAMGSLNDGSVVCRVDFGSTSFLFTGDAELAAEERLLRRQADVKVDVLKVGHHGSRTSTSSSFLTAVSPAHAVICVGDGNRYGHPHVEVLHRLQNAGVEIYRTDVHGTVIFVSDGRELTVNVQPWVGAPESEEKEDDSDEGEGFVGSVRSDVYHYPACRHAESILPANRHWFDSPEDAREAGYRPCGVCRPPGGE